MKIPPPKIAPDSLGKGFLKIGWLKKILFAALAVGLLFVVGTGALLYYAVSTISTMFSEKPDMDLIAMERLISDKSILLSEVQNTGLMPIIKELSNPDLAPEQIAALKMRLRDLLAPSQLQQIEEWKTTTAAKARGLWAIPPGVTTLIETYTGISTEMIQQKVATLQAWWQTMKPAKSAEQLS